MGACCGTSPDAADNMDWPVAKKKIDDGKIDPYALHHHYWCEKAQGRKVIDKWSTKASSATITDENKKAYNKKSESVAVVDRNPDISQVNVYKMRFQG